jgi:asparagine synthase (glutamine-hydrolysing)
LSGIHGILCFNGRDVDPAILEHQARALAYRGQDRRDLWQAGEIGMGHLLNRVTAEDGLDAQPYYDPSLGLAGVADVRLDNREELASALSIDASELAGLPDSVLLFRSFQQWGEHFVDHLIGDFTFAIWDARRKQLVLGRDHIGQRHLFFHHGADCFAFASDPRGLWPVPGVPRSLSRMAVGKVLVFDRAEPRGETHFESIFGLQGGTVMRVGGDGTSNRRSYWEPRPDPAHLDRDDAYYFAAYRKVLAEAVQCRIRRATRPAGLLLGGGFDSGAIAGLAGPVSAATGRKLVAISSVMPEGRKGYARDARPWVELLAREMTHLDVRTITHEGADLLADTCRDFPVTDGLRGPERYISTQLNEALAGAGVRVVMDGHGGDYTLNPRAGKALLRMVLRGELRRFVSEFRAFRANSGVRWHRLVLDQLLIPLLPVRTLVPINRWRRGLALSGSPAPVDGALLAELRAGGAIPASHPPAERLKDIRVSLAMTLRWLQSGSHLGGSLLAAAKGMELTQPFHDKRVIELALAIPERLIVRGGRDRYLARTALADILPAEFQRRGSKNDAMVPDHLETIGRAEPQMLEAIDRMEREGRLSSYFDFARMRRMLTGRHLFFHRRRPAAVQHAARALLHARYIEWFDQANSRTPERDNAN